MKLKNLLRSSERRRLEIAEILYAKDDWVTLEELANQVKSSKRILKYDFVNFEETFDDFSIETSHKGVRLVFQQNKGLKSLYNNVLEHSTPFKLLEMIFFKEDYTAFELADVLYVSPSTLYRLIDHINEVTIEYGFQVETNPCRLVGSEEKIRHFFIQYFFEKYTNLDWPYGVTQHVTLDNFLNFFIELTQIKIDFAYYNIFKLITSVGLVRYKNEHFVDTTGLDINFPEIISDLKVYSNSFKFFEDNLQVKIDHTFINQVLTPFVVSGYSLNQERLQEKMEKDDRILNSVHFLKKLLDRLAKDNDITLTNPMEIIFGMQNSASFESYDPRSGYVLYNQNKLFADVIKNDFPAFYKQIYEGLSEYRKLMGLPVTKTGLNYMFYILFTYWEKLVVELRQKFKKVKILIISNRHTSHSYLLRDFIEYEFKDHLLIDIYDDQLLTTHILEKLDYDFIVANFPLPQLQSKNSICIENIPTYSDILKIQKEINHVSINHLNMA